MYAHFSGKHRLLCFFLLLAVVLSCTLGVVPFAVHAEQVTSEDITYEYEITPEGTARILNVMVANPNMIFAVPETLDGYTVTSIGPGFLKESVSEEGTFGPVTIPKTVTEIDPLFLDGVKLKGSVAYFGPLFEVAPENPVYSFSLQDATGCLIDHRTGRLISVILRNSSTCVIPEGVKILGNDCFHGQHISELSLPDSLEIIEPQSLQSADEIVDVLISGDNAVFFAYQGQLRDHKERVYYPFTEDFPEEGYYIDPTISPEKKEAQQKQEKRENVIGNILGVAVILAFVLLLVVFIVQFVRRDGHLTLKKTFSMTQQIFSGTAFLACCLMFAMLFRVGREFGESLTDFGFIGYLIPGVIIVYGVLGIIIDFATADSPFWAIMTILMRLFLLPIAYVLLAMENILNAIFFLALAAFALLIVIRGALLLAEGLGFGKYMAAVGAALDAMTEDRSVYLNPTDELKDFRYETPLGDKLTYWGPDGEFYKVKTKPFSRDVTVIRDGETLSGKRMPDGSIYLEKPQKNSDSPQVLHTNAKAANNMRRQDRRQCLLYGILSLLPYLLLLGTLMAYYS